jgi:hypothetical protein
VQKPSRAYECNRSHNTLESPMMLITALWHGIEENRLKNGAGAIFAFEYHVDVAGNIKGKKKAFTEIAGCFLLQIFASRTLSYLFLGALCDLCG